MANNEQISPDRHVGQIIHEPVSGKIFVGCHAGGGLWVNDDGEDQSGASSRTELIVPTFMPSQSEIQDRKRLYSPEPRRQPFIEVMT